MGIQAVSTPTVCPSVENSHRQTLNNELQVFFASKVNQNSDSPLSVPAEIQHEVKPLNRPKVGHTRKKPKVTFRDPISSVHIISRAPSIIESVDQVNPSTPKSLKFEVQPITITSPPVTPLSRFFKVTHNTCRIALITLLILSVAAMVTGVVLGSIAFGGAGFVLFNIGLALYLKHRYSSIHT